MSLSDKEISALYFEALGSQHLREQDRKMVTRFAHAVEYEVRKSDEALIRHLVEALVDLVEAGEDAWGDERPCVRIGKEEITTARARLEGNP
ncbi:hypothetical protein J8G26_08780 [Acidovorax sp. JG5]|uniref:hypothetical protein n=1 Tax=Acidovorax sp. JG5 TaxID=2822718 RepID=UPI001B31EFDC|nr:hypothetical protein [Acidovorax sp. JG5]MBP3980820.1 hypothetical protein [Acidovorax sp. JG5]